MVNLALRLATWQKSIISSNTRVKSERVNRRSEGAMRFPTQGSMFHGSKRERSTVSATVLAKVMVKRFLFGSLECSTRLSSTLA